MKKTAKQSIYDPAKIEKKWQKVWEKSGLDKAQDKSRKKKFYGLIEFPYPSGEGLHVGHIRSNTAMDIIARKRRREGYNVLYPIGWDAFGLPTENYAIKTGIQPAVVTKKNADTFRKQLKALGFSFDWTREIDTTDPAYYRWTQWIFLQLLNKGLAYKKKMTINWCPKDLIGLANEEVVGGRCERCGTPVEKKEKEQWMLAITKYAERLDKDLDETEFLEKIKIQQRNWIGKSAGAEIDFRIAFADKRTRFVLIHGFEASPETDFFPWLKEQLERRGHDVEVPALPNSNSPKEEEQVEHVLKNCRFDENTVIVGHSLGGVVAMKALMKLNRPISGLVLVAPARSPEFRERKNSVPFLNTFSWDYDYGLISKLTGGKIAVLSDLKEKQSISYHQHLSQELHARLIQTTSIETHFTSKEEPAVLDCVTLSLKVYTTRPNTIFGVTYVVMSPEHPFVEILLNESANKSEVGEYIRNAKAKTDIERTDTGKEKTGVELKGLKAINPANNEEVPIWIADYVLAEYGTGAVMAVPAHDERDWDFAKKYGLGIKNVIEPKFVGTTGDGAVKSSLEYAYSDEGLIVNSAQFNGKDSASIMKEITSFCGGKRVTKYKLRDWVFSRQRYWGEPIPVVHCEACKAGNPQGLGIVPIPEKDLPVLLPKVKNYQPTKNGESPLATMDKWVNVKCPVCKGPAKRETDTMPNWAGSSWYYLRYIDPKNKKVFADPKKLRYWTPVDWYNGGMEHTTLHLLYSRFWHKFLYDQGLVPTSEPYKKRTSHGLILADGGEKMSKSKGNVINPDGIVKDFGADSLRLYEMFMGPFDQPITWSTKNIIGVRRFIEKVWRLRDKIPTSKDVNPTALGAKDQSPNPISNIIAKTVTKVTEDIEAMRFNTAISSLMIAVNEMEKAETVSRQDYEVILQLLAPFAPHVTEELWAALGNKKSIHISEWPKAEVTANAAETVTIMVQVNGKVRGSFTASDNSTNEELEAQAKDVPDVKKWLEGKSVIKVIVVPKRLVNIVIN